ncbi:MAG: ROK family protein [Planctomycetes bacterium]|nr:ROK family protein [Planctomycetota bacterium]
MTTIGLDVGGTKIHAVLLDTQGSVLRERRERTPRADTPDGVLAACVSLVGDLCDGACPAAVGIGFPGLVDRERGIVRSSVILPCWVDVPIAAILRDRLGVPCVLDNDVNQAARAEVALHPAADVRTMVFLTVGTGIGGALVIDGRILAGATGLAGELGHIAVPGFFDPCVCGRRGCVGTVASGTGIERMAGLERGALMHTDLRHAVVEHAIARAARALGHALASVMNVLNPALLVIGGGVSELGTQWFSLVEAEARREAFPEIAAACRFETARAGRAGGAIGAALDARSGLAQE